MLESGDSGGMCGCSAEGLYPGTKVMYTRETVTGLVAQGSHGYGLMSITYVTAEVTTAGRRSSRAPTRGSCLCDLSCGRAPRVPRGVECVCAIVTLTVND